MTEPKDIAALVTKKLGTAPQRRDGEPMGEDTADPSTPAESEDVGVEAATDEVFTAFKAGNASDFKEALTSLIEMVVRKEAARG